ncbi:glycosyltransferase [Enterococcus raffinosus]|uniref:Glycosyltransferase n=1 Tax=Enterococcus raffinosus TaxID=71452 RepID=A0AAW8T7M6_9ENTE|nr:glycosyltransferase [Enterococcus raffinosus]MDT2528673.1 glycosyltransferase [Enterococcus raffinosus]MDT2542923.1 glycosyltransferase [Enterococcus raffinosus]MDT2553382.1 glycosyltransferase [Enterococcus raffinosus]QZO08146.1 glycosyltransferase [Enterococcus raffinosus]
MFEIVVVLYNMTFSESSTIKSLNKLLTAHDFSEIGKVVIFDNSAYASEPHGLEKRFLYYHSPQNVGLAKAYNYALKQGNPAAEWLVTLDQDTTLTQAYLEELIAESYKQPQSVAAIAPVIKDGKQQISPVRSDTLRPLHTELPKKNQRYSQDIMVINSATALRVSFLKKIGGYNEEFPLDYLDHWLSWRIFTGKKQINILSQTLQHQLSVLDYANHMNFSRYQAIIQAEKCYYSLYATQLFSRYRRQLLLRGCKQLLTGKFNYGKITFKFLFSGGNNGNKGTKAN